ncbi:TonB-dependent receptor [bacterium]|nr:TonB-dependent receptor [bacterium]
MHSCHLKTSLVFLCVTATILSFAATCFAQSEEELKVLQLFYNENDLVVTATRSEKPISQVAENITIITSDEIQAVNAHTVADVLNNVTGLQLSNSIGPGSGANIHVQGSASRHVLVMIDGVVQNNLGDGYPDVGAMRVQQVERIEIVKGPASSSWGSSLGGVINVITKSPDDSREFGGAVSASIGERSTGDYRGEVSGTTGSLGYYLAGGGLLTDGLQPNSALSSGNVYAKLEWRPTDDSTLTFSVGYDAGSRGFSEYPSFGVSFHNPYKYFFTTLAFSQRLSDELTFDIAFRGSRRSIEIEQNVLGTDVELQNSEGKDTNFGGSARINWQQERHNLIVGTDVDFGKLQSKDISGGSQDLDKWALYANDTIRLWRLSITPGLRYDHTSTNGDFWSPSLGITCAVADSTIIRGYVARGFSIPPLGTTFGTGIFSVPNPNLKMEEVWSYSAGFETAALKYVWLKTTYFRHDVSDALTSTLLPSGLFTTINSGKQRREGVEVELKTTPVFHLSFTTGFTFINAKDRTSGEVVKDVPRYAYDAGIQYDDSRYLRAVLKGRYIDWNASPENNAKYGAMVWDLNLSRKLPLPDGLEGEVFFTAHNIFNGAQHIIDLYKNPGRWFEGGLRFSF